MYAKSNLKAVEIRWFWEATEIIGSEVNVSKSDLDLDELRTSHNQTNDSPIRRYIISINELCETDPVPSKKRKLFGSKNFDSKWPHEPRMQKITTDPTILKTNFCTSRLSKSPTLSNRVDQDLEFRWFW